MYRALLDTTIVYKKVQVIGLRLENHSVFVIIHSSANRYLFLLSLYKEQRLVWLVER